MAEPFIHQLRVRYAECDSQGVLFNANYLAYIDHTITELWRAAYGGYTKMLNQGVDIVVAEANLRFLGSARFDDEITIEASVTNIGTTSVTSSYRFLRDDQRCCSRRRCATCSSTGRPRPRRRFPSGRATGSKRGWWPPEASPLPGRRASPATPRRGSETFWRTGGVRSPRWRP